jgi:hypothetical protein
MLVQPFEREPVLAPASHRLAHLTASSARCAEAKAKIIPVIIGRAIVKVDSGWLAA